MAKGNTKERIYTVEPIGEFEDDSNVTDKKFKGNPTKSYRTKQNSFLHCSAYENVIFCQVMHQQSIIDSILEKLDAKNWDVKCISLIIDEINLRKRLSADVKNGIRTADVIDKSVARISLYQTLDTIKIDTSNKIVQMIADEIIQL